MPPRKIPKSRKNPSENSEETSAILERLKKHLRSNEDSDDDVGVDLDEEVGVDDPIVVAESPSNYSNLLQFIQKDYALVYKELNDGNTTFSSMI